MAVTQARKLSSEKKSSGAKSTAKKATASNTTASKTSERKLQVVSKHKLNANDTGSAAVQIALITDRLEQLQGHFQTHKKDFHSQRGLLKLVGKRRRLLDYLKRTDLQRYRQLIQDLGIRK